jgi:hypothetical protein
VNSHEFEDRANFRIKFASISPYGFLIGDAQEEYTFLFEELPQGWVAAVTDPVLETVEERLSDGRIRRSRKLEFRGPLIRPP